MVLDSSPLLTVKELAEQLRISVATAYVLLKQGRIASFRIGGRRGAIRVRPSDLEAYLQSTLQQVRQTDQMQKPVRIRLKHLKLK